MVVGLARLNVVFRLLTHGQFAMRYKTDPATLTGANKYFSIVASVLYVFKFTWKGDID
jgi:hypothetical protein